MHVTAPPVIHQRLTPGIHQLTVDADGRAFDWDSLFVTLNKFGNVNQRTGPWDFGFDGATPLVPAYWVFLNDRRLGLWFFNRPSVRQLRAKRFKGEAQFWIEHPGDYELRFEPYRAFTVAWEKTDFGVSPDDTVLDKLSFKADRHLQRLLDNERWDTLRRNLDDPAFPYSALLREAFGRARQLDDHTALPLLAANYRLQPDSAMLERARAVIAKTLALPAWGNPRADGYSHNCDYGAAQIIFDLVFALNFLGDELGETSVRELLARLDRQCEMFLELALLNHGYWGGSILQGHGFMSFQLFTTVAYGLLGWLPNAERWLRFCLPRMERSYRALPTDGVLPGSSYHRLDLHVARLTLLRELHRHATGKDVYDRPAFHNLVDFLVESYCPETRQFLHAAARGDLSQHTGGVAFLDQMAGTFRDAEAAWLAEECRRVMCSTAGDKGMKAYHDVLWAALLWEASPFSFPPRFSGVDEATHRGRNRFNGFNSTTETAEAVRGSPPVPFTPLKRGVTENPRPPRRLRWFQDSNAITYRDDAHGILFSSRLGNSNSRTSWQNAPCPCDRINFAPMAGNFAITKLGKSLIQTAEGGYSMRTELGNVVLVDGQGQKEDLAYAMGYVDVPWTNERIEEAKLDYVRMQLAPVYEGLDSYTREWFFEPVGPMRLVDTIKARAPHRFTWLFHTYRVHPITAKGGGLFTIQNENETLELRLARSTTALADSIADTLTVWAYSNQQGGQACHHLAFETREPVREVTVEFTLR